MNTKQPRKPWEVIIDLLRTGEYITIIREPMRKWEGTGHKFEIIIDEMVIDFEDMNNAITTMAEEDTKFDIKFGADWARLCVKSPAIYKATYTYVKQLRRELLDILRDY